MTSFVTFVDGNGRKRRVPRDSAPYSNRNRSLLPLPGSFAPTRRLKSRNS